MADSDTTLNQEAEELRLMIDEWISEEMSGIHLGGWQRQGASAKLAKYLVYLGYERRQP